MLSRDAPEQPSWPYLLKSAPCRQKNEQAGCPMTGPRWSTFGSTWRLSGWIVFEGWVMAWGPEVGPLSRGVGVGAWYREPDLYKGGRAWGIY